MAKKCGHIMGPAAGYVMVMCVLILYRKERKNTFALGKKSEIIQNHAPITNLLWNVINKVLCIFELSFVFLD